MVMGKKGRERGQGLDFQKRLSIRIRGVRGKLQVFCYVKNNKINFGLIPFNKKTNKMKLLSVTKY